MSVFEEKHSEMVKPYQWNSYHQQEHFYPNPIFNPEWPHDQPTSELIVDRPDLEGYWGCFLTAIGNYAYGRDDCDAPIRVRFLQVSASEARADPKRVTLWKTDPVGNLLTEIENPRVTFPTLDRFEVRAPRNQTWANYIDEGHGNGDHVHLRVFYNDVLGSVCSEMVSMWCEDICSCPSGTFAFDDGSTPDTIAPGGSITLYVSGGCAPYSWAVTGTGYTLDNASTSGLSNGLNSASGSCDCSDYSAYATITVTDNCSDEVSFTIRNTGGKWTAQTGEGTTTGCGVSVFGWCNRPACLAATLKTWYHTSSNGYPARWTTRDSTDCQASYAQNGTLDPTGDGLEGSGSGAWGGTDVLTRSELGCAFATCCICQGTFAYWTCTNTPPC
jgi:hypothetical protein